MEYQAPSSSFNKRAAVPIVGGELLMLSRVMVSSFCLSYISDNKQAGRSDIPTKRQAVRNLREPTLGG